MPATTPHWILGSCRRDLAFLVLPGFVGVALGWALPAETLALSAYLLLVTAVVDSGHVYTTWLRTYANAGERQHLLYKIVPPTVAATFALWFFLGVGGLWTFVVYATAFHHVRQFFGVSRWYQKLEGNFRPATGRFLYALTLLPLFSYHFRPGATAEFYSEQDLWLHPHEGIYLAFRGAFLIALAGWLIYEVTLFARERRVEWGRVLSVGGPAGMYAAAFFWGRTPAQVLIPLMLAHGVGYFGMMSLGLVRTRPNVYPAWGKAMLWVLGFAVVFGSLEGLAENFVIDFDSTYPYRPRGIGEALFIGLYLVPLFTHFILDAFIWRGTHREAKALYSESPPVERADPFRKSA